LEITYGDTKANSQTPTIHWATSKCIQNPQKTLTNTIPVLGSLGRMYLIFFYYILPLKTQLILKDLRSRGVLLALRNAATFYLGGKVVNVAGPGM